MATATELHVRRDALTEISAHRRTLSPGPGEALLHIERFALTANNMTYAAHGVDMAYWHFFPAPEGFGIVPVWGFAAVVESHAEGVAVGDRFYGYWPMASHALVTPIKTSPRGFTDGAAHRAKLPPVYNNYVPASAGYGAESVQALFRPLYTTSFVLDVMLADSPAKTLVLASASSKTALGLAQAAHGRQRVIGLTSAANHAFVAATGYYDAVIDYADVAMLAAEAGPAALVDFSGNGDVRRRVHETLGAALIESHIVGDTHWDAANTNALPGVAARPFFAPTVIVERVAEWGAAGFETRLAAAWAGFMASTGWLRVVEAQGAAAAMAHWRTLAAGRIDPADGVVLSV
jgi:hypothetical protein